MVASSTHFYRYFFIGFGVTASMLFAQMLPSLGMS